MEIGSGAFSGCSSLETLTLPFVGTGNTSLAGMESGLFGCVFGKASYTDSTKITQQYGETALYTAFRRVRNTTPNTQRQIILCERAVELLTTTDRPIEEISTQLGFSSSAYFRKIIRAHTGLTPRMIRQNAPM